MRKNIISKNLQNILAEIPQEKNLVAVSKTFPFSDIEMAYGEGQRDFGENRVQELTAKAQEALERGMDIRWHFIGRLQSNKVKKLLQTPNLFAIHSISSLKQIELLKKLSSVPIGPISVFLQINTSLEEEKAGFIHLEELKEAVGELDSVSHSFPLLGLMTMGGVRANDFEGEAHRCFRHLQKLREQIDRPLRLSMGMGRDYPIALSHGADYIRIGELVFGPRK